jgi:hypothetical protein
MVALGGHWYLTNLPRSQTHMGRWHIQSFDDHQ